MRRWGETRWSLLRYWWDRRASRLCMGVARRLPRRLRMWVVVDAANEAIRLYPRPDGYAGPDGLGYAHLYDGALREAHPNRDRG